MPRALPLRVALAVVVEHLAWSRTIPDHGALLRRAARHALKAARDDGWRPRGKSVGMTVALIDDRRMRVLNREFRGRDQPTNVLSFPAPESAARQVRGRGRGKVPRRELGDIAIALGMVRREAKAQRKTVADHLAHLMVHAVLHLLGYDHESDPAAARMEDLERAALAAIGIADPYRRI
jgi:probable rRNA maturation factor